MLQMTICGYEFVVTNVNFSLQRRSLQSTGNMRELNVSLQHPWAAEALRIDDALQALGTEEMLRIGRISFPKGLSSESLLKLQSIIAKS